MPDNSRSKKQAARTLIERRLGEHLEVINALITDSGTVADMALAIVDAYRAGGKILTFGNGGGSAADAQHFAGELVGRLYLERSALPPVALSTNTSNMTAIANDFGYDSVFSR